VNDIPDVFTPVILKLQEIGAFNFLFPFMLVSAVTYGLLRKSQIFGPPDENMAVNGVVALMISFMVWSIPITMGINMEEQLGSFLMHGFTVTMVLLVAIMLMGMFAPPNLPEHLVKTALAGNKFWAIMLLTLFLALLAFATSGAYRILLPQGFAGSGLGTELATTIGVLILLIVPLIFIAWGGGKPAPAPASSEKKE